MTEEDATADEPNAADRFAKLERTVEALADRVGELETNERCDEGDGESAGSMTRRSAMGTLGLAGLLGLGATTASADAQGQVGTESDPLRAVHTEAIMSRSTLDIAVEANSGHAGNIVSGHSSNGVEGSVRGVTIAGG
ncbi:hypothetical protein [Halovivax cerinus]|uniref:Uncharacterized protein n=1 Tax=Halovivax cerinus TaxID=1487865 RepID=A0ABD5NPG1_9EURY|nr:hypothetical protein [Halovivax cerinus]